MKGGLKKLNQALLEINVAHRIMGEIARIDLESQANEANNRESTLVERLPKQLGLSNFT